MIEFKGRVLSWTTDSDPDTGKLRLWLEIMGDAPADYIEMLSFGGREMMIKIEELKQESWRDRPPLA